MIIREGQEVSAFWEALGRNDTKNDDMDTQVMCIQVYIQHCHIIQCTLDKWNLFS